MARDVLVVATALLLQLLAVAHAQLPLNATQYSARATGSQVQLPFNPVNNRTNPITSAVAVFTLTVFANNTATGVAFLSNIGGAYAAHIHFGNISDIARNPEASPPVAWPFNSTYATLPTAWMPIDILDAIQFTFTIPPALVPALANQLRTAPNSVYVDVHSTSYRMGEVRGQLLAVPSMGK